MKRVHVALAASALLSATFLAHPIGVAAATGSVGSHYAQASCYGTPQGGYLMAATAPQIFASVPRDHPGIAIIGSQHNQFVAYKVNVFYSTDAVNWQLSSTSSWRAAQVGDGINDPFSPTSWYDYDSAKWVSDTLTWNLLLKGYYRAAVLFYWFADSVSDAGSDYVWADHFDYAVTYQGGLAYCSIP